MKLSVCRIPYAYVMYVSWTNTNFNIQVFNFECLLMPTMGIIIILLLKLYGDKSWLKHQMSDGKVVATMLDSKLLCVW